MMMNRLSFIRGTACVFAATATKEVLAESAASVGRISKDESKTALIGSAPVLQNAAETSMGVSFTVRRRPLVNPSRMKGTARPSGRTYSRLMHHGNRKEVQDYEQA